MNKIEKAFGTLDILIHHRWRFDLSGCLDYIKHLA